MLLSRLNFIGTIHAYDLNDMLKFISSKTTQLIGGENYREISKEMGYGMSENITRGNSNHTTQKKEKR